MPNITEQQLSLVGQALSFVVKDLKPNTVEAKELISECKTALDIISSVGKKQSQYQPVGGAAFLAHKSCCATCSSGEIKQLLSRFVSR